MYQSTICFIFNRNETRAIEVLKKIAHAAEPKIRPNVYGPPVEVRCDFYVQSLGPVNEVDMDYNMEIYFRAQWVDERLSFTDQDTPVQLPPQSLDILWLPDIYFPNEKEGRWHIITVPNKAITVFPNGTIRYSSRLTLRLNCNMLLMNFPLDYQNCHIKISSYSYDTSHVKVLWFDDSPVQMEKHDLSLSQFELLNVTTENCKINYKLAENFSCLQATFHLRRQIGFYVLQTYIPSILIVMLSWVSFWINKDAVPARISLGVTTVLTMTTQLSTSRSNSMRVSYPKAIDVWYASCMLFVFGALLEYALINVMSRSHQPRVRTEPDKGRNADRINSETHLTGYDIEMQCSSKAPDYESTNRDLPQSETSQPFVQVLYRRLSVYCNNLNTKAIDHASRTIFPCTFAVFNLIYWAVYSQPNIYDDGSL
ncbi:hypothetical protein LSH36_1118g00025 [Paralvinella palmiformis]|uniref:Uncharacterized protein n=1 Tax=Paralvinella palmiformis TaxID=53620 RepID=A0AAD9IVH1_9ANNE|nr:hypothetical protein LSH36_1118g00025 [Paralvinella palmiformis]